MNDALRRDHRDWHQDKGAHALGPGCPAEEQPPYDDDQPAGSSAKQPEHRKIGSRPRRPLATAAEVSEAPLRSSEQWSYRVLHFPRAVGFRVAAQF
ncbi:MAG: hypothetical protein DMF89_09700 [Acidobacteria bacterium]|nr:MAG: hypothetical protein DMF89_09700 [Acidobacteriota bacterium]